VTEKDNLPQAGRRGEDVWYLTLTDPDSGTGFWVRLTRPGAARDAHASVAFCAFDPTEPGRTFGLRATGSAATPDAAERDPEAFEARGPGAVFRSGHSSGALASGGHMAEWALDWATGEPTVRPVSPALSRAGGGRTTLTLPNPSTTTTGRVVIDGRTFDIRDAAAQQGHLCGTEPAQRWAWAHCGDFRGDRGALLALTAQVRRGPFLTPYITSIAVAHRGRWIRFRKISPMRDFGLGTWRIDVASRTHRLTGRIEAPTHALIRMPLRDPRGGVRHCHNSEIASSRVVLFERRPGGFQQVALLESRGTTHAEWAGRTPAGAVPRVVADAEAMPA
jgi:hypothetical protein